MAPLQGRTPLWLACDAGHADEVEVLLRAGADVNAKSFPHEKYQVLMGVSNLYPLQSPLIATLCTWELHSYWIGVARCPVV